MASCKKVTEVPVPAQAQNRILSYKITNVQGNPIEGVVNDDAKTIKVYLPYYYYLTALEPEIKVSEGATITPATGTIVDDLLDVFDNGRDIKYNVTAKDGTKATYTLQLIVQQGNFELEELSPSATEITELTYGTKNGSADLYLSVSGDFPSGNTELDRQLIKITLTAQDGSEYVIDNNRGAKLFAGTNFVYFVLSSSAAPGLNSGTYKVKVRFYSKTVSLKNPIKITITQQ
ncbi:hypothetical protein D0C36_03545 [Mucilaginibacter conchicola]|uniref:DUF5018 domain-containing protein n=2 Tax=Mucilaginibacter conchicola TaxID=2303333 RepID=A0A372NWZ3_9SPHI|nr:hypothetical protein D0C36_03545 [Mucilaginibacter conchicola]